MDPESSQTGNFFLSCVSLLYTLATLLLISLLQPHVSSVAGFYLFIYLFVCLFRGRTYAFKLTGSEFNIVNIEVPLKF